MATVKLTTARRDYNPSTTWITDVRTVQLLKTWIVEPARDYAKEGPDAEGVSPLAGLPDDEHRWLLSHTSTTYFGPYETDDPRGEIVYAMAVAKIDGRDPLTLIYEKDCAYLMGDDGGTIDRL